MQQLTMRDVAAIIMKINKKQLLFISLFIVNCSLLIGLDFNFRPRGFVYLPSDSITTAEGYALYDIGGGGDICFELDLLSVWPNPAGLGFTLGAVLK